MRCSQRMQAVKGGLQEQSVFPVIASLTRMTADLCAARVSNALHTNLVVDIERRGRYLLVHYLC